MAPISVTLARRDPRAAVVALFGEHDPYSSQRLENELSVLLAVELVAELPVQPQRGSVVAVHLEAYAQRTAPPGRGMEKLHEHPGQARGAHLRMHGDAEARHVVPLVPPSQHCVGEDRRAFGDDVVQVVSPVARNARGFVLVERVGMEVARVTG